MAASTLYYIVIIGWYLIMRNSHKLQSRQSDGFNGNKPRREKMGDNGLKMATWNICGLGLKEE